MFGLSIEHLLILLLAALFILGPERLPGAAAQAGRALRKVRGFASEAQAQLKSEIGPEFQDLRKPLQDLQALREFHPRTIVNRYLLDDSPATPAPATAPATAPAAALPPGERPPVDPDAT